MGGQIRCQGEALRQMRDAAPVLGRTQSNRAVLAVAGVSGLLKKAQFLSWRNPQSHGGDTNLTDPHGGSRNRVQVNEIRGTANGHCKQCAPSKRAALRPLLCPAPHFRIGAGPKRGPGERRGQHLLSLPLCSLTAGLTPPVTGR